MSHLVAIRFPREGPPRNNTYFTMFLLEDHR
jgi:hypothetical protein